MKDETDMPRFPMEQEESWSQEIARKHAAWIKKRVPNDNDGPNGPDMMDREETR